MSHLGGVALTSPSLHTERISEYKLNYALLLFVKVLNSLLNFYETLHSCSTQPADVHEGIPLLSKI
jgi:hypothetical protein